MGVDTKKTNVDFVLLKYIKISNGGGYWKDERGLRIIKIYKNIEFCYSYYYAIY